MTQYLREIFYLLGEDRRKLPWLILLFLGSSLLDLIGIGLVGPYVALVLDPRALDGTFGAVIAAISLPREQRAALVVFGLILVSIFLLKAIASVGIHYAIMRFSHDQQVRLKSALMHMYQHLPYTEFLQRNSSEYVHAIDGMTDDYSLVVQVCLRSVCDAIVAVALLGLLAWQNAPVLALLAGLLLSVVYGYDRLFRKNLRGYGERVNQAATIIVRGIHEGIEGLKEIRILGKEDHFLRMVRGGATNQAHFRTLALVITQAPRHVVELTLVVFIVLLVLVTLFLGNELNALVPTLGVFGVAALRLMPAASTFSSSLIYLRYSRDSVSFLHRDLSMLSRVSLEIPESIAATRREPFQSLVLDRIQFTYPNASQAALDDISMEVRVDESIGLIGPSGSGKTTLVDVLLGLLEPQQGELRFNGRPLKKALGEWRAQVAYIPQQILLVDDTLRRNVALGVENDDIDEIRLMTALRQARLAELVTQLPEGVETIIGERGVRLSGGQRQRVALARAFYHGRDVLMMDEATSALDNETEREIIEEIHQLKGRKTLIVIAHRLTTVQHCDRLFQLTRGKIKELSRDECFRASRL